MSQTFTLPEQMEEALLFIEAWVKEGGEELTQDQKDIAIRGLQSMNSWMSFNLRCARKDQEEAEKTCENWKKKYYGMRRELGKGEEHLDEAIAMLRKFCGQEEE